MNINGSTKGRPRGRLFHRRGITYFTRDTERGFFFVLTLVMLLLGVLHKLGLL